MVAGVVNAYSPKILFHHEAGFSGSFRGRGVLGYPSTGSSREALEEAASLREEADEKLARYDAATSELAALRLEKHALKHDLEEIPERINKARLDALIPDDAGEDPALLGRLSGVASVGAAFAPP